MCESRCIHILNRDHHCGPTVLLSSLCAVYAVLAPSLLAATALVLLLSVLCDSRILLLLLPLGALPFGGEHHLGSAR